MQRVIAVDTETTGLSVNHGSRPFFVSVSNRLGQVQCWEWPVDPLTRKVTVDTADVKEVQCILDAADIIVGHNFKFDAQMLASIGVTVDWSKVRDTLIASHLIDSSSPHDLTWVVKEYLGADITPAETELRDVVLAARRIIQHARLRITRYGKEEHTPLCDWLISDFGVTDPETGEQMMPSSSKEHWRGDGWLPMALATSEHGADYVVEHPKAIEKLIEYGCVDTAATMKLWLVLEKEIARRGLEKHFEFQMRLPEIASTMEQRGISVIPEQVIGMAHEYRKEAAGLERLLVGIADSYGYPLQMPKGTRNKSLEEFVFGAKYLNMPVVEYTKSGNPKPSFTAEVRERYEDELPRGRKPHLFIESLNRKVDLDKAVGTLEGYQRFMTVAPDGRTVMYSSLNQTGTKTLQWSSNNPNQQNASKQGKANLRQCLGPSKGRVWYSLDAQNIQLRVPAYECGEQELVEVFDHPEKGPYYGSYHLVVFDVVHPELFALHGKECKTLFEDTQYQWVKNANFARQFGAQERKVDATFRVKGAYKKIAKRFPKIDALNRKYIGLAHKHGYVETIPRKDVDPTKGYPLVTPKAWDGSISPTVPFCYHVAGTAQEWMRVAMVRCEEKLRRWRAEGIDVWMIAQVHDELVFDSPARWNGEEDLNMPLVLSLKETMERCGDAIGIPTPVSIDRHVENWSKGVAV